MKADLPSRTAQLVALGRALANSGVTHVPEFSDPTARIFLSERGTRSLEKTERAYRSGKRGFAVEYGRVMADMMALRTLAIDHGVRDAITRGARQLVILGAGYDGRAWRMKELAGVKVFEVDHPATQGAKREKVPLLPRPIGAVSFVPTNFEKESVSEVLARAGHDRSIPTCWIWEGVVMYLTRDAMRATLADIARLSGPRSTLIINYHAEHRNIVARLMFRLLGEAMISAHSRDEMKSELRAVGFEVREDGGMADWNRRFAAGAANETRGSYMRVLVASRVGPAE
jgi:methyltransferase (TIGR00027 family)